MPPGIATVRKMPKRDGMKWEPGEKEAINKELQTRPLYLCDPDKSEDCPKTYCAHLYPGYGECRYTLDPKCAKTDNDGNPVRITSADELYKEDTQ